MKHSSVYALIVDDNPDDRFFLHRAVSSFPQIEEVFTVGNPDTSADIIAKHYEQLRVAQVLLICDINLASQSGLTHLADAKEVLPHANLIAISGAGSLKDRHPAVDLFVEKDVNYRSLVTTLQELLK
ncbi:MAG: hypothetical protein AAF399_08180 [Bacteroidota bacterium]